MISIKKSHRYFKLPEFCYTSTYKIEICGICLSKNDLGGFSSTALLVKNEQQTHMWAHFLKEGIHFKIKHFKPTRGKQQISRTLAKMTPLKPLHSSKPQPPSKN